MKGHTIKGGHKRPTKSGAGMTAKGVAKYRRDNPGSKLKTAVTEDKPKGKRASRRKSYCARSAGQMKKFPKAAANPNSRLRQARRRWKCQMTLSEARRILEKGASFSPAVVEEAKEVIQNFTKKRGSNVMKTEKTGKKAQMAYGGTVNGKRHMYSAGGSVEANKGLLALKKSGPKGLEAYNKITKGGNQLCKRK